MDDPGLWTMERHVAELEAVRTALGLGKVHLFGQSWGAFLGLEYALGHPDAFKTLILEGGCANVPHLIGEMQRLRAALGSETVAMMLRHEAEGTNEHPEYQGALNVLMWRHVCRLQVWPPALMRSITDMNSAVFNAIQGRNEFTVTGSLKGWDRTADLHRIVQPVLVLCGYYDEVTPAAAALMHEGAAGQPLQDFRKQLASAVHGRAGGIFCRAQRISRREDRGDGLRGFAEGRAVNQNDYWAIAEADIEIQNPMTDRKLRLLEDYCDVRDGLKVLDVGCGKAWVMRQWAERYDIEGTGLETNPAFLDFAHKPAAEARQHLL